MPISHDLPRRWLLLTGLALAPGLALAAADPVPAPKKACVADEEMEGLRLSLHYVEVAPDSAKTCSGCSFFTAGEGGCGACQIFSGPSNRKGHCDSWAAKA